MNAKNFCEDAMNNKYNINGFPESAKKYNFIIARLVDGQLWYYGADNDLQNTINVAANINGIVFENQWRQQMEDHKLDRLLDNKYILGLYEGYKAGCEQVVAVVHEEVMFELIVKYYTKKASRWKAV